MMEKNIINAHNYDEYFANFLKKKKARNVLKGRFDLEYITLNRKSTHLIKFLSSFDEIIKITYKILFWDKNEVISDFLKKNNQYDLSTFKCSYRNGIKPGILFIEDKKIDHVFIKSLLDHHFNHELAKSPSLNIRVQICLNLKEQIILLDIYDDRGFDIYFFL